MYSVARPPALLPKGEVRYLEQFDVLISNLTSDLPYFATTVTYRTLLKRKPKPILCWKANPVSYGTKRLFESGRFASTFQRTSSRFALETDRSRNLKGDNCTVGQGSREIRYI